VEDSLKTDTDGSSTVCRSIESCHRQPRPTTTTVVYREIPYTLDLEACRRALVAREVRGEPASLEDVADSVGVSRSSVSRFFAGRGTSLSMTLRILAALRLDFSDVASPVSAGDNT
jgi:hypothetical protein